MKIGKTHFVRSLRTKDTLIARKRIKTVKEEFERIIEAAQCNDAFPRQPIFASSQTRPTEITVPSRAKNGATKTFEQVFTQFLNDPTRKRAKKTVAGYRDAIEVIYSVIPQATLISDIDRDICRQLLEILQWLPSNASKRFPDMDAKRASEMAKKRGLKDLLGPITINSYMLLLSSIMNFAVNEGIVDRNPCRGLRVIDPVKKKDKRLPFSQEQLSLIFNSPIYRDKATEYLHTARFWVPLIALFTGARMNEICALNVADIQTLEGIMCIVIRAASDKAIKTDASERVIPIPDALLEVGFAELVAFRWNKGLKNCSPNYRYPKMGITQ